MESLNTKDNKHLEMLYYIGYVPPRPIEKALIEANNTTSEFNEICGTSLYTCI